MIGGSEDVRLITARGFPESVRCRLEDGGDFSRARRVTGKRKCAVLAHFTGPAKEGTQGARQSALPTLTRFTPIAESSARLI